MPVLLLFLLLLLLREDHTSIPLANGVDGCHSVRVECWSCSPVRRRADHTQDPGECRRGCCSLLTPEAACWGDNSDSGQGTFSQPTARSTDGAAPARSKPGHTDCDTDPDDTSAFDYSSVTTGSPEGTLRREVTTTGEEEEEEDEDEEEDSQEPVLLKPSLQQREAGRERTVCLRWQIPRLTPHPPLRGGGDGGLAPCLVSSYGKRLVSVRTGSPPLHPKSAFRPIWDHPSTQVLHLLLFQRFFRE